MAQGKRIIAFVRLVALTSHRTQWLERTMINFDVHVQWQDGDSITAGWERFKTTNHGLRIKEALVDDSGTYTCKGVNGFGSEQISLEIVIVGTSSALIIALIISLIISLIIALIIALGFTLG